MKKLTGSSILCLILLFLPVKALFAQDIVHILEKGETLYRLSQMYDVSVDDIMAVNGISDPSQLSVGREIIIRTAESGTVSTPEKEPVSSLYEVKPGDTYYSIAKKYGLDLAVLLNANNRTASTILKSGETLVIPGSLESGETETPRTAEIPAPETAEPDVEYDDYGPVRQSTGDTDEFWWPVSGTWEDNDGRIGGVRFYAAPMSPVFSVSPGQVVYTGIYHTLGNSILIEFSDYQLLYVGLGKINVAIGDAVTRGTHLGDLPFSDTAEIKFYFAAFRNGKEVNPELTDIRK